jgi:limonene 1,2-monooxygenase
MRETGCGCGAGPGLLASDALVLGIDPMTQRDRMAEGIDVIPRLFRGETVTEKTDWYTLVGAKLHLPPYTKPYPETAVVSAVTSGGRLAGNYDLGMICVAATNPFGYDALASNWQIACDIARRARPPDGPGAIAPGWLDAHRRDPREGLRPMPASASRSI